jgi:putative protease
MLIALNRKAELEMHLKAAIHNGADAIYIGVPGFNARGRTVDFELSTLKATIEMCHLYGVKVNLALNILTETEIMVMEDLLIIQNIGNQ